LSELKAARRQADRADGALNVQCVSGVFLPEGNRKRREEERRISMRGLKVFLVVLAAGLLIGGVVGMAQAAQVEGAEGYHGSGGPDIGYPPDYNGFHSVTGWAHDAQAGGYVGYPPDYSNSPEASGWLHADPQTGWIHMGPSGIAMGIAPAVPVKAIEGPDVKTS
jgi:hypothetical protein